LLKTSNTPLIDKIFLTIRENILELIFKKDHMKFLIVLLQ